MARVAHDLSGNGIVRFLKEAIDPDGSLLITDEYRWLQRHAEYPAPRRHQPQSDVC